MNTLFESENEPQFVNLCKLSDLREGIGKRFMVNETDIALYNVNGNVYAVDNICPHQQAAILYDGFIEDSCVVCPSHGWKFDLKTGRKPEGSRGITSYPVEIVNGNVLVKVTKKEFKW